MPQFIRQNLPIWILTGLVFVFFAKLFMPEGRILVTPEFGMSDLWHQNLPFRFLLKDALNKGGLPLWTDQIGTGFPLFAEGQVAALNLVNLLPTLIFPAAVSFNISLVLIFLLLSMGIYLYARELGISKAGSFLVAIAFTFSAKVVTQLNHPNVLLAFAYFPLSLYFLERYFKSKRVVNLLFLSLVFSQQVFAGHLQMTFYAWIIFGFYFAIRMLDEYREVKKTKDVISWPKEALLWLVLVVILALGISLIQLWPSWEFIQHSTRAAGVAEELDPFPFRLRHLALFLRPDVFGIPADASYPLDASSEGLFAENSVYLGILPLALAIFAVISTTLKVRTLSAWKYKGFFVFLLLFSLALSLGGSNPLFFLFKLPLVNFFRIPPRFLFFTVFSLAILSGFGLDSLLVRLKRLSSRLLSTFYFLFFTFSLVDLWSFGFNYHPTVKISEWIEEPPPTAEFIKTQDWEGRLIDLGTTTLWNNIFWQEGWEGQLDQYQNLRNSLFTNSSVYYGLASAGVYSGVQLTRLDNFFAALKKELAVAQSGVYLISDHAASLLGMSSIKYLISPIQIESKSLRPIFQTQLNKPLANFAVFENTKHLPRVRSVKEVKKAENSEEAAAILNDQNFDPSFQAVVEGDLKAITDLSENLKITEINFSTSKIKMKTVSGGKTLLLLSDTYYPGWKAFVDDEETEIFPANLNQRLIRVPQGVHQVTFLYQPGSLKIGLIVSLISLIVWGGMLFKFGRSVEGMNSDP